MSGDEEMKRALRSLRGDIVGYDRELSHATLWALGPRPDYLNEDERKLDEALEHICYPDRWLHDILGMTPFFKALHQIVQERGCTPEAARSVRHDLQTGKLDAVFILTDGREVEIKPYRWRRSEPLWWSGWEMVQPDSSGQALRGDVFIGDRPSGADRPPAANDPARYTPPFMQLMFEAIEHFGLPGNSPKAETLREWFVGRSMGSRDVTPAQAKYLATFVRSPDKMAGGQPPMSSPKQG